MEHLTEAMPVTVAKSALTVVVSGPSGAGKSTLCERFVEQQKNARLIVTTTTRPRREGEVNGVDYQFVTDEEFVRGIEAGEFLEHAMVHGYRYGSPKTAVAQAYKAGHDVILEIDVQGGLAVKQCVPDAILVFVVPSDLRVLRQRLLSRGTDSLAVIERRLNNAKRELDYLRHYDCFVFNDDLDQALKNLATILEAERHRVRRYDLEALLDPALLNAPTNPQEAKA